MKWNALSEGPWIKDRKIAEIYNIELHVHTECWYVYISKKKNVNALTIHNVLDCRNNDFGAARNIK